MADGVFTATETEWGWACTVTGGTAVTTTVLAAKGTPVKLKGVYMTAQATTDIFTLKDGDSEIILVVAGGTKDDDPKAIPLWGARVDGLQITHGGATSTGRMSIFKE